MCCCYLDKIDLDNLTIGLINVCVDWGCECNGGGG